MSTFFNHNIHAIDNDRIDDMMELVQVAKTHGSAESIAAADRVETYLTTYKQTEADDLEHEAIIDCLTSDQEEKLKEVHAKNYMGTDDNMPEAYERWLMGLSNAELKSILGL